LVGVVFVVHGLGATSFLARVPERQDALDLTDGELGVVLVGLALGAILVSPAAAWLIRRMGSGPATVASGIALGATLPLAAVAPTAATLFGALTVIGATDAACDIGMNANGASHQAELQRSVMHRLHAAWALGALAAAALGALAARANVSLTVHLTLVGVVLAAAVVAVQGRMAHDHPSLDADAEAGSDPDISARTRFRPIVVLCVAISVVAIIEGAPTNWAAVHLKDLGTSDATAALGVAAFTAGMVSGRLVGDPLTDRWGASAVLRLGMTLAAAGFALGAAIAHPAVFMAGMLLAGLGISGCFPLMFGAAATAPGLSPGTGIATTSLVARIGFLVQPVLVGITADHVGLRPAFAALAALAAALAVTAATVMRPGSTARVEQHASQG